MLDARTIRRLRTWHLYLGVAVTPLLLMFATSGAWQLWGWHAASKTGEHQPPWLVTLLTTAHTAAQVKVADYPIHPGDGYRWLATMAAAVLVLTSVLGLVMAWRIAGPRVVAALLAAGVVVPVLLLTLG